MRYDDQALGFDERAAVPAETASEIVDVLGELVSSVPGQCWLELGPGSGSLSLPLIRSGIAYVGLDQSRAMLDVFQRKLDGEELVADLRCGDANEPWPVPDDRIEVLFSARAVHHLDVDHVAREALRVASPKGAWVVLGRVTRPRGSVRSVMRRRMRELLQERGYRGRDHRAHRDALIDALVSDGAERLVSRTAATWTRLTPPEDSLRDWEGKQGLAGLDVPDEAKASVLAELRVWAAQHYGDVELPLQQEEFFELSGAFVKGVGRA
jgi:ubiquinone/menaquinone biosynthesis C-methylase UbiE